MAIMCGHCAKAITRHCDYLTCFVCKNDHHINCVNVSIELFMEMRSKNALNTWNCGCSIPNLAASSSHGSVEAGNASTTPKIGEFVTADLLNQFGSYLTAEIGKMIDVAMTTMRNAYETKIEELKNDLASIKETSKSDEISKLQNIISHKDSQIRSLKDSLLAKDVNKSMVKNIKNNNKLQSLPGMPPMCQTSIDANPKKGESATSSQQPKVRDMQCASSLPKPNNDDTQLGNLEDGGSWTAVVRSNKQRLVKQRAIIGTGKSEQVAAVSRRCHVHVNRLDPKTTEENLVIHLKRQNISVTECAKLNNRKPDS